MEKQIHKKVDHSKLIISILLVLITLALFWQIQDHGFLNIDDDLYITDNREVQRGLTWDGTLWAFRSTDAVYWHPVTWLSHMLDCQLYGLNPKGHHFNSLLLHAANTVLLFLALYRMTGALWRSAAVAALFGVHPLNIESVAWAADRKNVLSFFFGLLTVLSYVYYTERGGFGRYLLVFGCLAAGLMAKPILVTFPFVLLLLDFWPLGRLQIGPFPLSQEGSKGKEGDQKPRRRALYLILEKVPLFVLSALSVIISSMSARGQGILLPTKVVSMGLRIENAVVSYLVYLKKMMWPLDLAVFYPYPETVPFWQFGTAGLLLIAITVWVVKKAARAPYLLVGWLWYLGTLIPVIGLVQQGLWPALADRFAYVPLIGLFVMLSWGSESLVSRWGLKRPLLPITAGIILTGLAALTWWQLQYWKSSLVLFERALQVTKNNFLAHMNLGDALASQAREEEAIIHFNRALETGYPRPQQVHFNLGLAFSSLGDPEQAALHYGRALEIDPGYLDARVSLGTLFLEERQWELALGHFHEALRLNAKSAIAHNNIGVIMLYQGRTKEAVAQFRRALRIDPEYVMAKKNLQIAMDRMGSPDLEKKR